MPLFRRPDGVLVSDESNVRKMMPYLMRGRNESAVYHEQLFDLTKTRPWLRAYNRAHADAPATLFHLMLFAVGRVFHERPGINRFIAGGHIYQRNEVALSFAAKKRMDDQSPLVTVKMTIPRDERFEDFVPRVAATIEEARTDRETTVDKELKLALALPGPLVRGVMGALRALDGANLLPASMIQSDPMFASVFLGNLGSLGLDNTFHHLYEYGTISFFGAIGAATKRVVAGRDGQPVVRDSTQIRWTFDERITDGFYCATSLKVVHRLVEDPEQHVCSVPQHKPAADVRPTLVRA